MTFAELFSERVAAEADGCVDEWQRVMRKTFHFYWRDERPESLWVTRDFFEKLIVHMMRRNPWHSFSGQSEDGTPMFLGIPVRALVNLVPAYN